MQTKLSPEFKDTQRGNAADAILRSCVHCGFCNATCPTYQLLGDELDGPRGRIYLIKQLLEGGEAGRSTQVHLDRCLTCLNCETTCPSGVEYGKLVSIGRELIEERVARPPLERLKRWALKEGLTSAFFSPALRVAQTFRRWLPDEWRHKLPIRPTGGREAAGPAPARDRKMLLLAGCVQPAMMPNVNGATARVLDAAGIQILVAAGAGCCGALREHLADHAGGLNDARRNINAWWPLVADGTVEAIVVNASACGLAVKQYGEALRGDAVYAEKAARISALTRDLSELLPELVPLLRDRVRVPAGRVAVHTPCTLQHGQGLRGGVDAHLADLGFQVSPPIAESHLCCGSAGTYSVLQPTLANQLRDRKLAQFAALEPRVIVSANVGCIQHLQSGTSTPVQHWIEVLDAVLAGGTEAGSP
jgi:glycolate oxidase iron-sulfur subunit